MGKVLEDPGSTSQMWVYRGGQPRAPTIFYAFHPSRSGDVPFEFLDGYRGWVQTDGYAGYDKLGSCEGGGDAGLLGSCSTQVR